MARIRPKAPGAPRRRARPGPLLGQPCWAGDDKAPSDPPRACSPGAACLNPRPPARRPIRARLSGFAQASAALALPSVARLASPYLADLLPKTDRQILHDRL